MTTITSTERAGWPVDPWCESAGFSRAKLYSLSEDLRPRWVKIGGKRLIIEPPKEYLQRIAAQQAA